MNSRLRIRIFCGPYLKVRDELKEGGAGNFMYSQTKLALKKRRAGHLSAIAEKES